MSAADANREGFRSLVRKAVIWRSGSQIVGQLISWVSTFLVLRILDPADYGLYAMAAVVLTLLGLLNGYGMASALVQRAQVDRQDLRKLFGLLLVVNGALALIQFIAAPFVEAFYEQPGIATILRVLSLVLLANPFLSLGYAVLARDMDFKRQAQVNLATAILGAIVMLGGALAGWGVWALVASPVAVFTVRGIAMMVAARAFLWPSFDLRGTRAMAQFGGAVALSSVFYFLQTQSDVVIAGRNFDAATVGIYTTALFLAQIFVNKIVPPLNEVAFTALSRLQADREAFARGFLVSARSIMLLAVPFCFGLAVAAEPIVQVLLGDKWLGIVPLLRILGFAIPWMVFQVLFAPATNAAGRPGIALRNSAAGALIMPLAFVLGARWGIGGMAWAWLLAYPLIAGLTAATSIAVIGLRWTDLVRAVGPIALIGLVMAGTVHLVDKALTLDSEVGRLLLLGGSGALVYLGLLAIFARQRLREAVGLLRDR